MPDPNPYSTPVSAPNANAPGQADLETIASGQKLIIFGILCYFGIILTRFVFPPLGLIALLAAVVLGILGTLRLVGGFGYPLHIRILLIIALFIPLIGLITLLILNGKATTILREGGYTVGILGASRS
jgi:hypothetical protein